MIHARATSRRSATILALALSGVAAGASAAGAAQAIGAAPADKPGTVEAVVVTARRIAEPLQKTPISITAFTAHDLVVRNVTDLSRIAAYTPNLVFDRGTGDTGSSNTAQIFIRGIGQSDFLFTTDPGVGVYIDGIYLPTSVGALMNLDDVKQVEVLKGPQGTLFGQNTVGGAINITTRAPADRFGGDASVTLGNYATRFFTGTVNLPLASDLLTSLSFSSQNENGYVKRPSDNSTEGDVDEQVVRGQVLWTPTSDFSLRLIGDYTQEREHAIPEVELGVNTSAPVLSLWNALVGGPAGTPYTPASISPDPNVDFGTGPNYSDLTVWGVSATASWRLGNATLKSISSFRRQDAAFGIDTDHSAVTYVFQTVADRQDQFSQEFQLLGSAFGDRLNYVFGMTYFHLSGVDHYHLDIAPGLFPIIGLDINELILTQLDSSSYSGYGHVDYKLTSKLSVSAGLRYSYVHKTLHEDLQLLASDVTKFDVNPSDNWNALTPQFGLQYQWTPNAMTYVSAARGFKAGGFNGRAATTFIAETPFNPEYVWTYEAGFKTEWFDRRALLNGAAFYSSYTNLQLTTVVPDPTSGGGVAAIVQNAGAARIDGFELDAIAVPVRNLNVNLDVGYLDSKYTSLNPNVQGITLSSKLPKTPKWTVTVGADYTWLLPRGELTLRSDYSFRSTVQEVANNDPLLVQSGFGVLSANLRYRPAGASWSVSAYGTNITNTRYMTNGLTAFNSLGIAGATYGHPREYGARLDFRF
jgi:iron complex outermembrane receptor protein